ncbi:MAG: hypothetical protein WCA08_21035 [Desulfoferrobacter sp.]
MIIAVGLLLWTALMIFLAYLSWTKTERHSKVYLLVVYNAIFLVGVFCIFPLLKKL